MCSMRRSTSASSCVAGNLLDVVMVSRLRSSAALIPDPLARHAHSPVTPAMVEAGEAVFERLACSVSPDYLVSEIYKAMHEAFQMDRTVE